MDGSPILAAWDRRVSGHEAILANRDLSDEEAAALWAEIDAADGIINSTIAAHLEELEVQIWTALHVSDAYLAEDAGQILRRDMDYVAAHKANFDWQVWPLITALQSLRRLHL